jgi:hypothetical protein
MTTISVLCLGCLLGLALAIFSRWTIALLLSAACFVLYFVLRLKWGDHPAAALMQSFALASIVQIAYVLYGYFLPITRPYADRLRKAMTEGRPR